MAQSIDQAEPAQTATVRAHAEPIHRGLFLLGLGIGLSIALAWLLTATTDFMSCGDCPRYVDIANNPFVFTASPWGYRILVPWVALLITRVSPVSLDAAFLALTLLGFAAVVTTIVYWFGAKLGHSTQVAVMMALLYSFSYGAVFYLHGYQNIGFWEHLAVLLGFIAIYHRRFVWLVPIVVLGEMVKESVVVLIFLYAVYAAKMEGIRVAVRNAAVLSLVYVAVFFLLRSGAIWRSGGNVQDYASYYTVEYFQWLFSVYGGPLRAIPKTLAIYAVTLPLAIIGWFCSSTRDRVMAMMAPLALTQLAFGGDVERLMILAFPGILLPIANLFRRISAGERWALVGLAIGVFYAHYYLVFSPRLYDPVTWENAYLFLVRPLMLGSFAIVFGWYFLVHRRRSTPGPGPSTA